MQRLEGKSWAQDSLVRATCNLHWIWTQFDMVQYSDKLSCDYRLSETTGHSLQHLAILFSQMIEQNLHQHWRRFFVWGQLAWLSSWSLSVQVVNGTTSVSKKFSGQLSLILHIESGTCRISLNSTSACQVSGPILGNPVFLEAVALSLISKELQLIFWHLTSTISWTTGHQRLHPFEHSHQRELASLESATLSKIESVQGRPSWQLCEWWQSTLRIVHLALRLPTNRLASNSSFGFYTIWHSAVPQTFCLRWQVLRSISHIGP